MVAQLFLCMGQLHPDAPEDGPAIISERACTASLIPVRICLHGGGCRVAECSSRYDPPFCEVKKSLPSMHQGLAPEAIKTPGSFIWKSLLRGLVRLRALRTKENHGC
jgi:hypothetical protein